MASPIYNAEGILCFDYFEKGKTRKSFGPIVQKHLWKETWFIEKDIIFLQDNTPLFFFLSQ